MPRFGVGIWPGYAMKPLLFACFAAMAFAAATVAPTTTAFAQCSQNCRPHPWLQGHWGYGAYVRTWGLGGPADAPWVGGSVTGVTPYGPYPYGPFVRGIRP
jgi:hypothetical protein